MSNGSKPPRRFAQIDNGLIERIAEIGVTPFAVYAALARFADADRTCFPAVPTIAGMIGKTDRTVQLAIRKLSDAGLVLVEQRGTTSNRYILPPAGPVKPVAPGEASCATPVKPIAPGGCNQLRHPGEASCARGVKPVAQEHTQKEQTQLTDPNEQREAIPSELDHADFRDAWKAFLDHRKEIRKTATPRAQRMLLKKCAAWGRVSAIAAIENAIAGGYQGLFEPSSQRGSPQRKQLPTGRGQIFKGDDYGKPGTF